MKWTKSDVSFVVLYFVYVLLIMGFAYYKGTEHRSAQIPTTNIEAPSENVFIAKAVTPPVKKHKKVHRVSSAPVDGNGESSSSLSAEPTIEKQSTPTFVINIYNPQVEIKPEPVSPKFTPKPSPKICTIDWSDEREILETKDAIEHNRYVGQKLWEKLECERELPKLQ